MKAALNLLPVCTNRILAAISEEMTSGLPHPIGTLFPHGKPLIWSKLIRIQAERWCLNFFKRSLMLEQHFKFRGLSRAELNSESYSMISLKASLAIRMLILKNSTKQLPGFGWTSMGMSSTLGQSQTKRMITLRDALLCLGDIRLR